MQHLTRSLHLLTRLSHPSSLTPTPAITAALGRTCCCLCLLTPSVVVTPPHRRVPRASLTDAPPVPPHQVQRFCVTLSFCVCFVRPSAQGRLLLRVLRAFRLLRCVKLFYQLATLRSRLLRCVKLFYQLAGDTAMCQIIGHAHSKLASGACPLMDRWRGWAGENPLEFSDFVSWCGAGQGAP